MPPKKTAAKSAAQVSDYRHDTATRRNNPPAGLASQGRLTERPRPRYAYDPHLPPLLRFDESGRADYLDDLIARAIGGTLSEEDGALLRSLLGSGEPWLEWTGKREAKEFVVDPVALHIHERISAQAILKTLAREDVQKDLFADPQQPYREAVRFYEHDVDWSNRMILGDSLQVMASLAHREDLAGKVQMIYMDPPYGIRFASNFQPEIGKRDVKDKESDLTREPEMVKAYRDTWTLGVHSYLSYLRDRLILARDMLTDSGSIFVQISDENVHRLRILLDEIFGSQNFCAQIAFRTSVPLRSTGLGGVLDMILWYARDAGRMAYNDLFVERESGDKSRYSGILLSTGEQKSISNSVVTSDDRLYAVMDLASTGYTPSCIFPLHHNGVTYETSSGKSWKTNAAGMARLAKAGRISDTGRTLRYALFMDDYPVTKLTNAWIDTTGDLDKRYVVQTHPKVIERCMLMTTKPSDLVFDPTCGSGTTAYVAEQWGRRWITTDTSRVALAIARQRLLTSTFPHYDVKGDDASDGKANPGRGFNYKTVPHVTLKSIAQNVALDPIFDRHHRVLDAKLIALNTALKKVTPELRKALSRKLAEKQKNEGKRAITDADRRRWLLPESEWREWEVPFDTDDDWPDALKQRLTDYRAAWRAKMDEVNATIAESAEQEELVDQPQIEKNVTRVSGPFTMEAVMPGEQTLGEEPGFAGEPEDPLDTFAAGHEPANAEAFLVRMLRLLHKDGVRFPDNRVMHFNRLEPIAAGTMLHGEGVWANGDGKERIVVVSIGPEHGPVTAWQVEEALREAYRRGADDIVFAGFSFDGAAQAVIQDDPNPRVRAHLAHIAPDVQMGGLLKTTPDSQLFTVFGLPRVEVKRHGEKEVQVEMQGVDIFDPLTNTIRPTRADKVAAWFVDADYDGRTFCITQAFFPDRSAWAKLERALRGSIDEERLEMLSGTLSLPFAPGKNKRVAVKVIDPRGNEVMRVVRLDGVSKP